MRERKAEMTDIKKESEMTEAMDEDNKKEGEGKEGKPTMPQNWFRFNGLNREDAPAKHDAVPAEVEATVVGSFLNGVFVSWEGEGGKKLCARMTPGKMYLNGRRNLQTVFRYVYQIIDYHVYGYSDTLGDWQKCH